MTPRTITAVGATFIAPRVIPQCRGDIHGAQSHHRE